MPIDMFRMSSQETFYQKAKIDRKKKDMSLATDYSAGAFWCFSTIFEFVLAADLLSVSLLLSVRSSHLAIIFTGDTVNFFPHVAQAGRAMQSWLV